METSQPKAEKRRPSRQARRTARRRRVQRAAGVFALYLAGEISLFLIQYYNTTQIQPMLFVNMAVRSLICTLLTVFLRPLAYSLLLGNDRGRIPTRDREVKSF